MGLTDLDILDFTIPSPLISEMPDFDFVLPTIDLLDIAELVKQLEAESFNLASVIELDPPIIESVDLSLREF